MASSLYVRCHDKVDIFPKDRPRYDRFYPTAHFWVDLYHKNFKDYQRYPNGLATVVGYWAETQILGGVILFERGSGLAVLHCTAARKGSLTFLQNKRAFTIPQSHTNAYELSDHQISQILTKRRHCGNSGVVDVHFAMSPSRNARELDIYEMRRLGVYHYPYDLPPPVDRWSQKHVRLVDRPRVRHDESDGEDYTFEM